MKSVGISLSEYLYSSFFVLLYLQGQFVHRIELGFGTEEVNELDAHRLVIDVAFEVEDMNLDAEVCAIVEGRAVADVQHASVALSVHGYTDGINPDSWYQLVRKINLKVGGREAYLAPHLITAHYGSLHEVIVPQVFGGSRDLARKQGTTDGR